MEGLEQKLREVPPEKRKVIVLVGRHPNEGTVNIANRHHEDWEKHGAVVVRIPAEWTPHGFWHEVLKEDLSREQVEARDKQIPDDDNVSSYLLHNGFEVPVVSFHGSPKIADSKDIGLFFSIAERNTRILHRGFVSENAPELNSPNHVLAEFCFKESDRRGGSKFIRLLNKERITNRLGYVGGQLDHRYVTRVGKISKETLVAFSKNHSKEFEAVLAHLAKTGLKPAKR